MIKSTDLIKKENRYFSCNSSNKTLKEACYNEAHRLIEFKVDQKIYLSWNIKDLEKIDEHKKRINRLAARLEREFLRANKKPKFIILHGTDIKEMDILTWNTGCDVPYYENAVFESKEEAKRFAELEEMDDFTIVEVLNEN